MTGRLWPTGLRYREFVLYPQERGSIFHRNARALLRVYTMSQLR